MKGYSVLVFTMGEWLVDCDAKGVNLLYAECVANYHLERGKKVRIVEAMERK